MASNRRILSQWLFLAALLGLPSLGQAQTAQQIADEERDRAYRVVDRAKSQFAGDIRKQADALVALAWPTGGGDPLVSSVAREQLTHFGADGMQALRQAIPNVEPRYQFDVVATLIESKTGVSGGIPSEYLPALEDMIWYGSLEAKRVAIPEAARLRYPLALLSIMDAASEHPELVPVAVKALGDFRNDRARGFLKDVMLRGHPHERLLAARALGRIGDRGMDTLREAARDSDAGCRSAALETLLPVTDTDDLSLLHEYIGLYPDENPRLHAMLLKRALLLEAIKEKQLDAEAASFD